MAWELNLGLIRLMIKTINIKSEVKEALKVAGISVNFIKGENYDLLITWESIFNGVKRAKGVEGA